MQEDALTPTDSLQLLVLAESCPWAYGDAVYDARALFALFDADKVFDGAYCQTNQPLQQRVDAPDDFNIFLFPNPANQFLQVKTDNRLLGSLHFEVKDALGRIYQTSWQKGEDDFWWTDIQQLPAGVYFVDASTPDGLKATSKFIKQ